MAKFRKLTYSHCCEFSQLIRDSYRTNLVNFNAYLHKPKPQPIQNQMKMLKLIFQDPTIDQNVQLLYLIRKMRLFSVNALDFIQLKINELWPHLNHKHKMISVNFLIEQRRQSIFPNYQSEIQTLQEMSIDQYINYLYCKSIIIKKLPFSFDLSSTTNTQLWESQLKYINKIQQQMHLQKGQNRKRSPLEIQVQSLLNSLEISYERQVLVNGISVDFLIDNHILLQVLGTHHYTVEDKLKGSDIFRALILNRWKKIKFIHSPELNQLKGLRKRLQYIKYVSGIDKRSPSKINWTSLQI